MKKLLAVTLVAILAFSFGSVALAASPPQVSGTIPTDAHTDEVNFVDLYPGFDWSEVVSVRYRVNITNFDALESPMLQFVMSAEAFDWWGQEDIAIDKTPFTYTLNTAGKFTAEDSKIDPRIGNWWGVEGTYTITFYTQAMLDSPDTGILTFIGIAAVALTASGTGIAVVSRKLKNK